MYLRYGDKRGIHYLMSELIFRSYANFVRHYCYYYLKLFSRPRYNHKLIPNSKILLLRLKLILRSLKTDALFSFFTTYGCSKLFRNMQDQ